MAECSRTAESTAAAVRPRARGFAGGSPEDDWAAAEADIDRMLAEGSLRRRVARR